MNPKYELDQIERYIDYLNEYPHQLRDTVESHFLPVLQRIFFREGFEVKRKATIYNRTFPFLLTDLDIRRPPVVVDFSYQLNSGVSIIPGFAYEWAELYRSNKVSESLLLIRNAPLHDRLQKIIDGFGGAVLFLDFIGLKTYASNVFRVSEEAKNSRAVIIIIDLLERLIAEIAEENIRLDEIEWFDVERLFHRLIEGLGFHAHLTPTSKDGGRDILACEILVDDIHWYNIEIKHWKSSRPGKREVTGLLETAIKEGRKGALFLSTSGITESAIKIRTKIGSSLLHMGNSLKYSPNYR